MIVRDPYKTRFLQMSTMQPIKDCINEYIITEYSYRQHQQLLRLKDFSTPSGTLKPVVLYGGTAVERETAVFSHPLYNPKNNWLALDLRAHVRPQEGASTYVARNSSEYAFVVSRFVLSGMWLEEKFGYMYSLALPHSVFAEWLSSSITRKFGLTMGDQVKLYVLSSLYYATLFTDSFDNNDRDKLRLRLRKEVFVEKILEEVFDVAGEINSIDDFCKACYRVTDNPRLQGFSYPVLTNVIARSWYSTQADGMAQIALDHPPTWIAMVLASVSSHNFKTTAVAQCVQMKNKRGAGDEFVRQLQVMADYKVA